MIKLPNLKIPASKGETALGAYAARALKISERDIEDITILKKSVDARRGEANFVYTLALRCQGERALIKKGAEQYTPPREYEFPYKNVKLDHRPVIVGMGPAGLFCALALAEAGVPCTVVERGKEVSERAHDIEHFWQTGELDAESNVQFGEGGAGTFSDGKINTNVNNERIGYVLRRFVEAGAPRDILYNGKPHIGTDYLKIVVPAIRERLISLGCDIMFNTRFTGINLAPFKRPLKGEEGHEVAKGSSDIAVQSERMVASAKFSRNASPERGRGPQSGEGVITLNSKTLVLALGNAARDTFATLAEHGITMASKPFSVGVRIEHLQADIDAAQYKKAAQYGTLPVSSYKLAAHLDSGRSVYSFCVCPGGSVVAAASEHGGVVTNGMSEYARSGENINGGLLVSVSPKDFDEDWTRAVAFQRELEQKAFTSGGENYFAPAQRVGDFMKKRASTGAGKVRPTYRPGVKWCNLWDVLPEFVCTALSKALPELDKKISGFAHPDAVLTAVETRSSCPVCIKREDYKALGIKGLYPIGEGAGYAGGIMSAAVDGIKCAEQIIADAMICSETSF